MKNLILLLIPIIFLASCNSKEVENPKQLKEEIIKEVVAKLKPKDTLFIVTTRTLGVCGNDERYDGTTTLNERLAEMKYIIENPYFVDANKDYKEEYHITDKVIIIGEAFDNEFTSNTMKFKYDELKQENVYDIQFTTVKKDTVYISIFDYFNSESRNIKLKMVQKKSKWNIDSSK